MKLDFEKGPWIRAIIIIVVVLFVVLVIRYIILRELDFGFSLIIAVLAAFIYLLVQRIMYYIRSKEI